MLSKAELKSIPDIEGFHPSRKDVLHVALICRMTTQGLVAKLTCDSWEAADWIQKREVQAAIASLVPAPSTGHIPDL